MGIAETEAGVDIYINPFLNFVLFWNKGIGFVLLSFDQLQLYNLVTILIIGIIVIIIFIIYKITDYRFYFYSMSLGGALGNLFESTLIKSLAVLPLLISINMGLFETFSSKTA